MSRKSFRIWDLFTHWKGITLHVPVGLLVAVLILIHPTDTTLMMQIGQVLIGTFIYLGFLLYQIWESIQIKDLAHPDIAGSLWGLACGSIVIFILRMLGINI